MKFFRRSISILLSLLIVSTLFTIMPLSVEAETTVGRHVLLGDINGDGTITFIDDLTRINNYINGQIELTEDQIILADVNSDGYINNDDVLALNEIRNDESKYIYLMDYGYCGDNTKYILKEDGSLVISGTGAMGDYYSSSDVPWYSYSSYVKTVTISNGVTSIGNYAFCGCTSLTSVTIPSSVTSIGNY